MTTDDSHASSRRDFLTGKSVRGAIERAGDALADELVDAKRSRAEPAAGSMIRLTASAMACDFSVMMNPGADTQIEAASEALELVHRLECQMSVYREDSELSRLNRQASDGPVNVEPQLFGLIVQACQLCRDTDGAFDPTSGPVIELWRQCRQQRQLPTEAEITQALARTGIEHVGLDAETHSIRFSRADVELNLGGIGKGYALDRAAISLVEAGLDDFLIHGGHSSVMARGDHNQLGGWPVGIRNPLFPKQRLATILLENRALSTSGSGVQHFRLGGKRYGHILDPRTGWPVEEMLSVTVMAPTAAEADALSTAFFVCGVENARCYCDNDPSVSALLIPPPRRGRALEPLNCGIPEETLFLAPA